MDDARLNGDDVCSRFEQSIKQLVETIGSAPRSMQGSLLAAARQRLDAAQLDEPPIPSTSRRSRALRRKFERGLKIQSREDADASAVSAAEGMKGFKLFYGAIGDIMLTGIYNDLELKTVHDGIEYVMKRDKFEGSIEDAIDYALCTAYHLVETNEAAWLVGLARFRLRGFNAPPWEHPGHTLPFSATPD